MIGYSSSRQDIALKKLRSIISEPMTPLLTSDNFILKEPEALKRDVLMLLLHLFPVHAIKVPRKEIFTVVIGSRIFEMAAFSLAPDETVPVMVITDKLSDKELQQLKYLDSVILPALYSLDTKIYDLYRRINADPEMAKDSWKCHKKSQFAKIFGVSKALLSPKDESAPKGVDR